MLPAQQTDGCLAGSWDPVEPWGDSGARVYSTALLTFCPQAQFRSPRNTQ